jgi:hypothetical protein
LPAHAFSTIALTLSVRPVGSKRKTGSR